MRVSGYEFPETCFSKADTLNILLVSKALLDLNIVPVPTMAEWLSLGNETHCSVEKELISERPGALKYPRICTCVNRSRAQRIYFPEHDAMVCRAQKLTLE